MRLFFAIELSDEIRQRLISLQEILRQKLDNPNYRWTDPSRLHVTLSFLGDVPESDLDRLRTSAEEIAKKHSPCRLQFGGLGAFSSASRPRVLWVGVSPTESQDASGDTASMAADLGGLCEQFGSAGRAGDAKLHVTLARAKLNPSRADGAKFKDAVEGLRGEPLGELAVSEFVLFSSSLGKDAPSYRPLTRFEL